MKLSIMQPYFMPYIGYFQLIAASDIFIIYDNIKYTKKGWINRNRILQNNKISVFTLPLKKDSDELHIYQRSLTIDFNPEKLLNQFKGAYAHATYAKQTFPLLEKILTYQDRNLFRFIHHSIILFCEYFSLSTDIKLSSSIDIDHNLKNQDKVLSLCSKTGATTYINPIGGMDLYSREVFQREGIELKFIKTGSFEYQQFNNEFIPWLSIIDLLMFNPITAVRNQITTNYELI